MRGDWLRLLRVPLRQKQIPTLRHGMTSEEDSPASGQAGEFPGTNEDAGKHSAVQTAGVGVAQGWMVAPKQVKAVGECVFGGMGKAIVGAAGNDASEQEVGEECIPGNPAEADDDAQTRQSLDFGGEVHAAVADLLGRGLVARRRAADNGSNPRVAEAEAVIAGDGDRLRGEA